MEAGSCHKLSSNYFNNKKRFHSTLFTPHFSRCMLIVFRFQPLMELFHILDTRESARLNSCMMIGLSNALKLGIAWQCNKIGYTSTMR